MRKSPLAYLAASALLLAPCWWQSRIQAGDLSSHLYNAWLAQLIDAGRAPGLALIPQKTNILFDLLLSALLKSAGARAAEHVAVSLAVLVFAWGAFAFASTVSGRRAWDVFPWIAMLAYGWVFHMGFFNFYIALGLCFWAMALLWAPGPRRVAAAAPILALALVAHALPVAWCVCLMAYSALASRWEARRRAWALACVVASVFGCGAAISAVLPSEWLPAQAGALFGIDQFWVFGMKYYLVAAWVFVTWAFLVLRLQRERGGRSLLTFMPLQLTVITAAAVLFVPTKVVFPGYTLPMTSLADRMSLCVAVGMCAVLACATPRALHRNAAIAFAVLFFAFLYADHRALNSLEDRMEAAAAKIGPGHRVISQVAYPNMRAYAALHMIDRVCINRCFSYGNYEPSSSHFRIRAVARNPIVVESYLDSWAIQAGGYKVKAADLPIFGINLAKTGEVVVQPLPAGTICETTPWKGLPEFIPLV